MSEDNLLSRRQSLLGIGAVGTALGGSALGVSSVFDGDETAGEKTDGKKQAAGDDDKKDDHDRDDETATKAGLDLEVVCHEGGEAKVRVRNKRSEEATLSWKVDIDGLDLDDLDMDDLDDLDPDDFDEDDMAALEAYARSQGMNVDADDLGRLEGAATVREAKFRVRNHSKEDVKLGWTVNSDKQGGKCYVDAKGTDSFWVTVLDDRKTSVTVTYEGEAVDTEKADADTECTDDRDDT